MKEEDSQENTMLGAIMHKKIAAPLAGQKLIVFDYMI